MTDLFSNIYCMKCKAKTDTYDPRVESANYLSKGDNPVMVYKFTIKGFCDVCDSKKSRFISKKDAETLIEAGTPFVDNSDKLLISDRNRSKHEDSPEVEMGKAVKAAAKRRVRIPKSEAEIAERERLKYERRQRENDNIIKRDKHELREYIAERTKGGQRPAQAKDSRRPAQAKRTGRALTSKDSSRSPLSLLDEVLAMG